MLFPCPQHKCNGTVIKADYWWPMHEGPAPARARWTGSWRRQGAAIVTGRVGQLSLSNRWEKRLWHHVLVNYAAVMWGDTSKQQLSTWWPLPAAYMWLQTEGDLEESIWRTVTALIGCDRCAGGKSWRQTYMYLKVSDHYSLKVPVCCRYSQWIFRMWYNFNPHT